MLVLTVRCSLDLSTELSELSTELRTGQTLFHHNAGTSPSHVFEADDVYDRRFHMMR